ncbi:helicase with zinc finger domain 2-like [Morone saxatilis]|uniref:helicase with zinc finger domain 2-like n=1 Tax=Morone saxatilis TaxID=34816 RepID=UPI0015E2213F|nr:helicase with zinc finger domain 2-like [Morone saxatilis]
MSASGSQLVPLLSTHDLKLVCAQCSVKEKEITYTLKSVYHQCARDLLLCKAKGGSKWRPVSKRPTFPNPNQYEVCYFFVEGSGCTHHKNRCTFARSSEEAAVWTFEKHQRLDHVLLCHLIAQSERGSDQPENPECLGDIIATLDLKAVCELCSVKEKEITYTVQSVSHKCSRNLLLAKAKTCNQWRPVSERPAFGRTVLYQKCAFFDEDSRCTRHGQGCTYARSSEEATVWNYVRDKNIDKDKLIRLVIESEPTEITPESSAESILQQFSGEFIELCKHCFHERPQKLTTKRWNETCSADAAHTWDPVLVYHLSENSGKQIYSQVRPLPQKCQFNYCSHVKQGKSCWHEAGHCQSAQSEVEMAVWKAEHSGLSVRLHLLQLSRQKKTETRRVTMYCKVCLLALSSPESFYKHCSSLEHAQLLSEDTTTKWRGRQPPHNIRAEFWLCERPKTCEYGNKCPKAHSVEELKEWMMRAEEEKEIRQNIEAQGLMSYNERLLEEYKNSSNEVYIISEQVDDVSISCDEELTLECEKINSTLQWNFHVETERQLVHVALLKQEPGASFTLGDISPVPCIYSSGEHFLSDDATYGITVSFTAINPGLYDQWLVLDFDMRPVLLRKLRVRVGQLPFDDTEDQTVNRRATFQSVERWHRGNRIIIPCTSRKEEQEELLKEYKPPQISFLYKSSTAKSQIPLNNDNYKERMHHFLYNEERAEDQVVSRLNVCGEITTLDTLDNDQFPMMMAPWGQLFCTVSIPCNLTPDTPEGQVLKRSIQSGLIAPLSSGGQNSKVYEAIILQGQTSENKMYLQLSKKCCSDLTIKSNESYQMEVQFQLDRNSFCTMHKAVDLLPDTKRVLPDFKSCGVPVNNIRYEKLNTKQQSAIYFITGTSTVQKCVAPLLIYGPFGTGKTFTLATAARELCKQPNNKVLICTHTNSSADLYVRDHFHPFIDKKNEEIRPIRIKANGKKALYATDEITLKYCFFSEDGQNFLPPTKAALDCHKIVITTTTMARHFQDLKLPEGYFTHILIDEASQMLECEALIALGLAGPNTRVVLAGDHMQMGPKLFSVDDHHRSNHTLLNRLFHYYQDHNCEAAQNSRIIFSENYRSTKEIVEFVSTNFYVGKNDVIKATGNIPAPANGRALKFHHVRGECLLDTVSMSWYNKEEVAKVVEEVQEILKHWPSTWGTIDQSSICILSEGFQVRQIRAVLLRRSLAKVHVENLANVQGKQFRAVIMTAVQTRDSLKTSHLPGLELFNDARVLNTAMTRAQSLVVVVGDAAALCCFGKCSRVWKSYVDHCICKNSVAPQHFTKDLFEKDIMETARFQKSEHVDKSKTHSDAILQELKDEHEQQKTEYSSDEDSSDINHLKLRSSHTTTDVDTDYLELCKKQPEIYKQGKLIRESYNRGYVIPFQNPINRISINGRANLNTVFTGDEVVVQTTRVVGITKEEESARVLVCLLEDEDNSKPRQNSEEEFVTRMMMPITKSAPKVRIRISRKRRNFLPIWENINGWWTIASCVYLDEKLRQNNVFVVQVICWKRGYAFPLGKVIDILPVGKSLNDALWILNEEFKVLPTPYTSDEGFSWVDEDRTYRQDIREVITFTVDPKGAKDLDDAISVRDIGDQYELGVHIADVASFVSPGSKLDEDAKQRGTTYYCGGEKPTAVYHMFPQGFSTGHFSLLSGQDRRVVSLMFRVNKKTNEIIGKPEFQLSLINSNENLSYEEAEDIISKNYGMIQIFDTVNDCVTVAYCFAKAQRKMRLGHDWVYSQPDDQRLPGERKAHLMIEELSVLFNAHASETLIGSEKTRSYTPLRCQANPDPEKIEELRKTKCAELIPLSFYVRHKVDHVEQVPNHENFRILTKVWKEIQSAAKKGDIDKMVDLIAADDIHPLLQPVVQQFRRCFSKAYVIRSNSSPKAGVGHYSLSVRSYTQASSPIRRYMDIVVQRLLHSIICHRNVQYTRTEISTLCSQFDLYIKNAKEYEQKAEQISYAVSMKKHSASKLAFVVSTEPNKDSFAVSFPFNKNIFAERLAIMYKDLQLWDQPLYDEEKHCITLTWKRRIYAVDTMQIYQELNMPDCDPCVELPLKIWKATVEAIDEENWDHAKLLIMDVNTEVEKEYILPQSSNEIPYSKTNTCTSEEQEVPKIQMGHEVDMSLQLQTGDILQVQMTSELKRGYYMPAVQLVHIKPKFEICVDHVHSPITCFSSSADVPSRIHYSDIEQYKQIWQPLCDMESAATAVDESESIVIENLVVNFSQVREGMLTGSFFLPLAWINEWAIGFHLSKCLLCIRKRGLKLTSTLEHSASVDPSEYTWVAHGVTRKEERKNPPNEGSEVEFYISHLPMEIIPDCVLQKKTSFTVEIIPKLLPDIRKEHAVRNIGSACDLVKAIALGQRIPKEVKATWLGGKRNELPNVLPELNLSQRLAVDNALNHTFTLIQGPPGTGKTVVGVYIVYHFLELNSKNPRKFHDPKDGNKKEVILYCGPSNKSVDVVAGYLLGFEDSLRPLRVYSQQVEMLDYPYPDCTLQFSRRTLRQECAKPELRGITLHHRMRQDQNPHSGQIKDFDRRIKLALVKKEELPSIHLSIKKNEELLRIQLTPKKKEELLRIQLSLDVKEDLQQIQHTLEEIEELRRIQRGLKEKEEVRRIQLDLEEKEKFLRIQLGLERKEDLLHIPLGHEDIEELLRIQRNLKEILELQRIKLALEEKKELRCIPLALKEKEELRHIQLAPVVKEELQRIQHALKEIEELRRIQLARMDKEEVRRIQLAVQEKEELIRIQLSIKEIKVLKCLKLHLEKIKELTAEQVKEYKKLLTLARTYELEQHDIILCTCTQSSTPSLIKTVIARQILIDECAMATEPQALIPLVSNKPEKIVLIGDHKQLRPIVKNARVKKLGMAKSLFERYYTMRGKRTVMLDTQYRMHVNICEFPSKESYEGKLKTGVEQPNSVLRVGDKTMPVVFGDIEGETIRLVVNTAKGNENSKANKKEKNKVIDIADKLVKIGKIEQQSIVILSPYNAQVSEIRDALKEKKMDEILVTTITKSQGSEWRYVIISTVCSLPSEEIESEPNGAWLAKHLGFVGDANQINVAITRAKEGLCIIGNQKLLSRSKAWKNLLDHYRSHDAVTDANKISVCAS